MEHILYWLWLTGIFGVKSGKFLPVIEKTGGIEAFYKSEEYPDIHNKSVLEKLNNKNLIWAKRVYSICEKKNIEIITYDSCDYPEILKSIYMPPTVLYAKGNIPDWDELFMIGVVGTRRATKYGVMITDENCAELSPSGATIVSGVAVGIDIAAIKSAINAGGNVVSISPCGLDIMYPKANEDIIKEIPKHGVLISEYPPGVKVRPEYFRDRNRIIAGLSLGCLVTEAPKRSGALITAHHAIDENRDVFVVTGKINEANTKGINKLITEGAKPVFSAEDIILEYPYYSEKLKPVEKKERVFVEEQPTETIEFAPVTRGGTEGKILNILTEKGSVHIDELMRCVDDTPNGFQTSIFMLEMSGEIERMPGNILKRLK